jgi:hypothetical protein
VKNPWSLQKKCKDLEKSRKNIKKKSRVRGEFALLFTAITIFAFANIQILDVALKKAKQKTKEGRVTKKGQSCNYYSPIYICSTPTLHSAIT